MTTRSLTSPLLLRLTPRPTIPSSLRAFRTAAVALQAQNVPTPPAKAANYEDPSTTGSHRSSKPPQHFPGIIERISQKLRETMPSTTETYVAYGVTQELYNECVFQAAYLENQDLSESAKFWYEVCDRKPTFNGWAQVTILHMWMLIVRIRAFDRQKASTWQQHFVDHFFYDSESKMLETYKVKSGGQRKQYLKDLYIQYRGMVAAFDEGLCKGDAILATAIWRNIFDARPDIDLELLAVITSYVRRVVSGLDKVPDDLISAGKVTFGLPTEEFSVVRQRSPLLDQLAKEVLEHKSNTKA
ncbi:Serine carboxypeptidase 3 [Rhizina undulata]